MEPESRRPKRSTTTPVGWAGRARAILLTLAVAGMGIPGAGTADAPGPEPVSSFESTSESTGLQASLDNGLYEGSLFVYRADATTSASFAPSPESTSIVWACVRFASAFFGESDYGCGEAQVAVGSSLEMGRAWGSVLTWGGVIAFDVTLGATGPGEPLDSSETEPVGSPNPPSAHVTRGTVRPATGPGTMHASAFAATIQGPWQGGLFLAADSDVQAISQSPVVLCCATNVQYDEDVPNTKIGNPPNTRWEPPFHVKTGLNPAGVRWIWLKLTIPVKYHCDLTPDTNCDPSSFTPVILVEPTQGGEGPIGSQATAEGKARKCDGHDHTGKVEIVYQAVYNASSAVGGTLMFSFLGHSFSGTVTARTDGTASVAGGRVTRGP